MVVLIYILSFNKVLKEGILFLNMVKFDLGETKGRGVCLGDSERKKKREDFDKNHAEKVLRYDGLGYPVLSVSHLKAVLNKSLIYPDIRKRVLEKLVDAGVFDFSQTGNYSVKSLLIPKFSVNPRLDGRLLYFVSGKQCDSYMICIGMKKGRGGMKVLP